MKKQKKPAPPVVKFPARAGCFYDLLLSGQYKIPGDQKFEELWWSPTELPVHGTWIKDVDDLMVSDAGRWMLDS